MRKNPNNELKTPPKTVKMEWVKESTKESQFAAIRSVMKKTLKSKKTS